MPPQSYQRCVEAKKTESRREMERVTRSNAIFTANGCPSRQIAEKEVRQSRLSVIVRQEMVDERANRRGAHMGGNALVG
jgi:hypothetical protein